MTTATAGSGDQKHEIIIDKSEDEDEAVSALIFETNKDVKELQALLDEINKEKGERLEHSVWDYAVEEARERRKKTEEIATLFFLGNEASGKSSLIFSFLEKNETPAGRTVALDFSFARRTANNMTQELCHIWELGGELTEFTDLIDLPIINCHYLSKMAVVLVLDLSQPKKVWAALECAVLNAKKGFQQALINMDKAASVTLTQELEKSLVKRLGAAVQDKEFIDPFPLPLVIIGTKYDVFQNLDPEIRKNVVRVLRLASHRLGAALCFYTKENPGLRRRVREILSHYAFKTAFPKGSCDDFNEPLLIPPGADSFEKIWPAQHPSQFSLDFCRHTYETKIGKPEERPVLPDPALDTKFAEPDIDQKRLELLAKLGKGLKVPPRMSEGDNQII